MQKVKLSNIRVMGSTVELWETHVEHIEKLVLREDQWDWLVKKPLGTVKLRDLNKDTSFLERYVKAKNRLGYEIEKIAPIIHRPGEKGTIRSTAKRSRDEDEG